MLILVQCNLNSFHSLRFELSRRHPQHIQPCRCYVSFPFVCQTPSNPNTQPCRLHWRSTGLFSYPDTCKLKVWSLLMTSTHFFVYFTPYTSILVSPNSALRVSIYFFNFWSSALRNSLITLENSSSISLNADAFLHLWAFLTGTTTSSSRSSYSLHSVRQVHLDMS